MLRSGDRATHVVLLCRRGFPLPPASLRVLRALRGEFFSRRELSVTVF